VLKRPSRTSAEAIRQQLAARIIGGQLVPGTPLDETSLAAEFAVSRTPIREALRLLAASGLIEHRPHMRAQVAKPDEATLSGMFEVMGYLEALCAGLSALSMSAGEREALDILHQGMARIVREGDTSAYADANEAFHAAIYEGAHNAYLNEITLSTRQRLQPFRRAQFGALGRLSRSHAEHSQVVDAILQGNRTAAEAAMREHLLIVEHSYQALEAGETA
jgi:DNA-binding GntR family transcriptional regulator